MFGKFLIGCIGKVLAAHGAVFLFVYPQNVSRQVLGTTEEQAAMRARHIWLFVLALPVLDELGFVFHRTATNVTGYTFVGRGRRLVAFGMISQVAIEVTLARKHLRALGALQVTRTVNTLVMRQQFETVAQ